jgi:hypothetical protein
MGFPKSADMKAPRGFRVSLGALAILGRWNLG